jgi:hypothetical protein
MFADMCRLAGAFEADNLPRRLQFRNGFVLLLSIVPVALFLTLKAPVMMVMLGGIAQSLMLPVLGIGAIYLRHRRLPREVAPSAWTTGALWITTAAMFVVMAYYAVLTARG